MAIKLISRKIGKSAREIISKARKKHGRSRKLNFDFNIYVRNFLNINELKNKIMSLHLFLDVGSKDSGHLWTRKITPRSEDG